MLNLLNNIGRGVVSFLMSISHLVVNGFSILADNLADEDILKADSIKDFGEVTSAISRIMKNIVGPIMMVIGVFFLILVIYLGIMYANAEDANKRKEVMGRLIGCCIGLVIIIVGITLCYAINWVDFYANISGHRHEFSPSEKYPDYCVDCGEKADAIVHQVT